MTCKDFCLPWLFSDRIGSSILVILAIPAILSLKILGVLMASRRRAIFASGVFPRWKINACILEGFLENVAEFIGHFLSPSSLLNFDYAGRYKGMPMNRIILES